MSPALSGGATEHCSEHPWKQVSRRVTCQSVIGRIGKMATDSGCACCSRANINLGDGRRIIVRLPSAVRFVGIRFEISSAPTFCVFLGCSLYCVFRPGQMRDRRRSRVSGQPLPPRFGPPLCWHDVVCEKCGTIHVSPNFPPHHRT